MAEDSGQQESTAEKTEAFYREAAAYNASLADQGQAGIGDPGQGEKLPLLTAAAEECGLGYVEIPAMKICLPLFFGGRRKNIWRRGRRCWKGLPSRWGRRRAMRWPRHTAATAGCRFSGY